MRAQLGQCVVTLKGHDNSTKEEKAKLSKVFPLRKMDQKIKVGHFLKIVLRCARYQFEEIVTFLTMINIYYLMLSKK